MKKLLLLVVVMITITLAYGQTSGGPDSFGYKWVSSKVSSGGPTYKWVDITKVGTLVTGLGDDNYVGPFTDTNGCDFYWYGFNKFYVGSNGFISLKGENIASPFPGSIPASSGGNNWIAPYMCDLIFSGTNNPGKVYYQVRKDSLIISFIQVPHWVLGGFTGSNTFQVIFDRSDSSIVFNYKSMDMGTKTSVDAAIGIENVSGKIGLGVMFDTEPDDNLCIKFDYPDKVVYKVRDAGVAWGQNEKSAGIFVKKGGDPIKIKAKFKNFGNQDLTNLQVYDTIKNSSGKVITNGSSTIYSLKAGADSSVTFSNTFKSNAKGTFSYFSTVKKVSSELVTSNNSTEVEINVVDTNVSQIILDYSDGNPNGTGIGWNGGNGGIGIYYEPPIHPARILATRFYITANATPAVGFYAMIYDDDGPNGAAGTLLDSVYVAPTKVSLNTYNVIYPANKTITIVNGGVYVYWKMGGAGINLGRDTDKPISRRTFEVLDGAWSAYRDINTEDFLVGLYIRYAAPISNWTYDASKDPEVSFFEKAEYNPYKFYWNFDDMGASSSLKNPVHTFKTNGKHTVCLTVTGPGGNHKQCKNITINNAAAIADFEADTSNDPSIKFVDKSLNTPTSWSWDFGDATAGSTMQNPTHSYTANGTYSVTLIASNATGTDTITKNVNVHNIPPIADFEIDTLSDPVIVFTDKSTSDPTSWAWDFGETGGSSSLQDPTYTYKTNGSHKVCLTASNGGGSSVKCKYVNIKLAKLKAAFAIDSSSFPEYKFIDQTKNDPQNWTWYIDEDNTTSTLQNTSYTFKHRGEHQVCLAAWNASYRDSICKKFFVKAAVPIAAFEIDSSADPKFSFSDASENIPDNWNWDFDESGQGASVQNTSHFYLLNGKHKVCLIASNSLGSDTACRYIVVEKAMPIAEFSYDLSGDPKVLFTDESKNDPTSWKWTFNDEGAASSQQDPEHVFSYNGEFEVCLKVSSASGEDSVCKKINIQKVMPIAKFTMDSSAYPVFSFSDLSTGHPSTWLWDFDDQGDDTASTANPTYQFIREGVHNVCLTVSNSAGSSSPECEMLYIKGLGFTDQGQQKRLLVYPNPFNESTLIVLKGIDKGQFSLRVINTLGQVVRVHSVVKGNTIKVSKGNLKAGSYYFEVYNYEMKVGTGKFIIY